LEENKDSLKILYLPKGSPEFNAVDKNVGDRRESMIY
jgi:transposase